MAADLPQGFSLREHRRQGTITLVPAGELDAGSAPRLRERLQALRTMHRGRLVLDLRALTFIDSTGVALLVCADAYAREGRWVLQLIQGPAPVRRVFELCGLIDRLPFGHP